MLDLKIVLKIKKKSGSRDRRRAVKVSASLLRAIGRPAMVRALMLLAAGLPSCKELWALSRWAMGAGIWARRCDYIKHLYTIKYFLSKHNIPHS
jgi:hypothetical protein